jgi:hypothetical protein
MLAYIHVNSPLDQAFAVELGAFVGEKGILVSTYLAAVASKLAVLDR